MAAEKPLEEWRPLKPGVSRVRIMDDPIEMESLCNDSGYAWSEKVWHMNGNAYTVVSNVDERECYLVYDPVSDTNALQQGRIFIPWKCVSVLDEQVGQQYAIAVSKALVGGMRFVLESVIQSTGQGLFLIKQWHEMTKASRLFTISSISAGLLLSIMGPVKEYVAARRFKGRLGASSNAYDLLGDAPRDPNLHRKGAKAVKRSMTVNFAEDWMETYDQQAEEWMDDNGMKQWEWQLSDVFSCTGERITDDFDTIRSEQFPITIEFRQRKQGMAMHAAGPSRDSMNEFLQGDGGQSSVARRVLIVSNCIFWGAMVYIYFLFDFECGQTPSATADLIFAATSGTCLIVEIWVAMHTIRGYTMLVYKKVMTSTNIFLTMMARYDTYGDVTSVRVIQDCEPITWVSVRGHVFDLHFELAQVMTMALILVVVFQILPFFFLLIARKNLLVAAKLGELNVLLATMENEAQEPGN